MIKSKLRVKAEVVLLRGKRFRAVEVEEIKDIGARPLKKSGLDRAVKQRFHQICGCQHNDGVNSIRRKGIGEKVKAVG